MVATLERHDAQPQLEEELEYCNVTNFRDFLLNAVNVLHRNPAKRYVVTKLGKPEAVLMSFETYSLMKKVMDRMLAHAAKQNSPEAIKEAFARLRDDWQRQQGRGSESAQGKIKEASAQR